MKNQYDTYLCRNLPDKAAIWRKLKLESDAKMAKHIQENVVDPWIEWCKDNPIQLQIERNRLNKQESK